MFLLLPHIAYSDEEMDQFNINMLVGQTVCASPEKFRWWQKARIPGRHDTFDGNCGDIPWSYVAFQGWEWDTVSCESFKTEEHKRLLVHMGKCCSDGRTVCDF